jgi:hypothetical protein
VPIAVSRRGRQGDSKALATPTEENLAFATEQVCRQAAPLQLTDMLVDRFQVPPDRGELRHQLTLLPSRRKHACGVVKSVRNKHRQSRTVGLVVAGHTVGYRGVGGARSGP